MKKTIRVLIAASALALSAFGSFADAGQFSASTYGSLSASDIADVVTDSFTRNFPASKFEIVVFTQAGRLGDGKPYCFGMAGVAPNGRHEMPRSRFTDEEVGNQPENFPLRRAEVHNLEMRCGRAAVRELMQANRKDQYVPQPRG